MHRRVHYDFQQNRITTPANVHLTAASNAPRAVTLGWAGGFGQTGWRVERSVDGTSWATAADLPATAAGHTDTGLAQGAWV